MVRESGGTRHGGSAGGARRCVDVGAGVAQDKDTAVHWYQQAARQSNEGAVRRLGTTGVTLVDG